MQQDHEELSWNATRALCKTCIVSAVVMQATLASSGPRLEPTCYAGLPKVGQTIPLSVLHVEVQECLAC